MVHDAPAMVTSAALPPVRRSWTPWLIRGVSLVVVLGTWEILGRRLDPVFLASPSAIVAAAYGLVVRSREFQNAIIESMTSMVTGYGLASGVGIMVGFSMGRWRTVELALDPYVTALYATPRVALIPLLILWFGIAFELRVAVVFLSSVFPIIINTIAGVKHVDEDLLETARAFAATQAQTLRTVILPSSLPFIFAGLRVGLAAGIIGVIVAEMTAAVSGLGALIMKFGNLFQTAQLFVPIVAIALISVLMTWAIKLLERVLTPWHRLE